MKQKLEERLAAKCLREQGYSVNEIVEKLAVAKSSVSLWVRNIDLTPHARMRLLTKVKAGQLISAENKRRRTKERTAVYRATAQSELQEIHIDRSLARIMCALLYWCEGAKNPMNGMRFTNSDPKLIRTFLELLRSSFPVDEKKIRVGLHLHEYHEVAGQIAFWSHVTLVSKDQFIRPYLKPHTGKRVRKDYPGCATIYYYNNDTARQLLAIAETFLEHKGV